MRNISIEAPRLKEWIKNLFAALDVSDEQLVAISENLVWSELIGRANFGVLRIPIHIKRLREGVLNPIPNASMEQTGGSTMVLDADNAFGHYAGQLGMENAIALGHKTGVGVVTVKQSNWYGTGAYFVNMAADAGMIGIALSNAFPKVVAHGGSSAVLGTNPFAFGAPRQEGDHILVDFATSSLAGSTVRQYLEEGRTLPEGLAVLPDGTAVRNPKDVGAGALTPFGGPKGFGIGLLVEILAGVVSGSGFSETVQSTYTNFKSQSDSGHCFIAIDPARFMPVDTYFTRLEALVTIVKNSGQADGDVRLPGEIRWDCFRKNSETGIEIPQKVLRELSDLCDGLDVDGLQV